MNNVFILFFNSHGSDQCLAREHPIFGIDINLQEHKMQIRSMVSA